MSDDNGHGRRSQHQAAPEEPELPQEAAFYDGTLDALGFAESSITVAISVDGQVRSPGV